MRRASGPYCGVETDNWHAPAGSPPQVAAGVDAGSIILQVTGGPHAPVRFPMNTSNLLHLQGVVPGRRKPSRLFVILGLGLVLTLIVGRPANAQSAVNCAAPVTSAPTAPAIVSAASTSYGTVLVEGSASY